MTLVVALIFVVVCIGVPGYYAGKAVQRDQTLYDCTHHGKTELNERPDRQANWIECRPIVKPR